MLALLSLSLASAVPPEVSGQDRACADDVQAAELQLSVKLDEISRKLAEEKDPQARGQLLVEKRRVGFAGFACQCTLSEDPALCAKALHARADLEQLEFEQQPTQRLGCPSDKGTGPLADCVRAKLGSGALVETAAADGGPRFTSFVPEAAGTRVISGSFDQGSLQIAAGVLDPDPLLAKLVEKLLARGQSISGLEGVVSSRSRVGGRFERFYGGLILGPDLAEPTDIVLCEEAGRLVPRAPVEAGRMVIDEEIYSGRLIRSRAQPMPCPTGWLFSADIPGIRRKSVLPFPLGSSWDTPDPPFVDGVRVRTFGTVTWREQHSPGSRPPYDMQCTAEGAGHTFEIGSPYGCELYLAADLNRDGVTDFIVHAGSESCEGDSLWMSGPEGWKNVAHWVGCC